MLVKAPTSSMQLSVRGDSARALQLLSLSARPPATPIQYTVAPPNGSPTACGATLLILEPPTEFFVLLSSRG